MDEFAAHAAAATHHLDGDPRLEDADLVIEQRIGEPDALESNYHLILRRGSLKVIDGPAPGADVTITQDATTARAVRDGALHAQQAFLTGRLSVDGDIAKLLRHADLLSSVLGPQTDA